MAYIQCQVCHEQIKRDIKKLQGPDSVLTFHRTCYEKALAESKWRQRRDRRETFRYWNRFGQVAKRQQAVERTTLTFTEATSPVLGDSIGSLPYYKDKRRRTKTDDYS